MNCANERSQAAIERSNLDAYDDIIRSMRRKAAVQPVVEPVVQRLQGVHAL